MTERDEKMTEQTLLRYTPTLAKLIDAWRKQQADGPSRADAFRRLTALALKGEGFQPDAAASEEPKAKKPAKGRK
jgi:hypothetical protein